MATLSEKSTAEVNFIDATKNNLDLHETDESLVQKLVSELEADPLTAIYGFGRDVGAHTAQHADSLLEQVRSKDLDVIGSRLSEVVVVAKTLNLSSLSENRSRIPLIGGLIDKMKIKGSAIAVKFQDVRTQVDSLLDEVQTMQAGLAKRIETLETTFESVKQEHVMLGAHIKAGIEVHEKLGKRIAHQSALAQSDPMKAHEVQDLQSALGSLEKRIGDMKMLQHSALQQLPMIRMVQANNRMLIEKFYTIKELTVPAWKRQFVLALSLNEQKNAVELANRIDDATNEFLRENARLLKDNTIATAKANQRMVIDVTTLQDVHDSLMSTVQEVVLINQRGISDRAAASAQLETMRTQLHHQLQQVPNESTPRAISNSKAGSVGR
ncbi:toxic anion resistance protein [Undibacterium curvum]|uniref:toxic anion resistance protein n=1 Tax=Undibacterium curvum TaxID=2762294 RepID=UPI003D1244AA